MRKKLCILLCIVTTLFCGCRTSSSNLRFGAANIGGMYYAFANTFATLSNENTDSYTDVPQVLQLICVCYLTSFLNSALHRLIFWKNPIKTIKIYGPFPAYTQKPAN